MLSLWLFAAHLFSRHQVLMDNEMPVMRCDFCSFITDKRCRFDDHLKMHRNIRDIPCGQCGKLFVTKKTLRQHVIKVHQRAAVKAAVATSPGAMSANVVRSPVVIQTRVQKLNDKLPSSDAVTVAETNTALPELVSGRDAVDNLFQSPTIQSSVEYQMLMPLPTSGVSTVGDGTASLTQVAAVSASSHPIIVGISLPTIDSVTTYQTFQPFDLQNARLVL